MRSLIAFVLGIAMVVATDYWKANVVFLLVGGTIAWFGLADLLDGAFTGLATKIQDPERKLQEFIAYMTVGFTQEPVSHAPTLSEPISPPDVRIRQSQPFIPYSRDRRIQLAAAQRANERRERDRLRAAQQREREAESRRTPNRFWWRLFSN